MEETFSGLNVFILFVVFSGKALKKRRKEKGSCVVVLTSPTIPKTNPAANEVS